MVITWDERKRLANLEKHGIEFAMIDEQFFVSAKRVAVRDGRYIAVGRLSGRTLLVVYKQLGSEGLSIISARIANRAERNMTYA